MMLERLLLPVRQWRLGRELGIFTAGRLALPLLVGTIALCIELLAMSVVPLLLQELNKGNGFVGMQMPSVFLFIRDWLTAYNIEPTMRSLLLLLAFMMVLRQVATCAEMVLIERSAQHAYADVTRRIFRSWLNATAQSIVRHAVGTWNNLIVRQCQLSARLITIYVRLYKMAITSVAYALVALAVNPRVTIVAAVFGVLVFALMKVLMRRAKSISRASIDMQNNIGDYLAGVFAGWKQVKVFNLKAAEERRLGKMIGDLAHQQVRLSLNSALIPFAFVLCVAALIVGFVLFKGDSILIDVSQVVILIIVIIRLLPSMQAIASRIQAIVINGQSLEVTYEIYKMLAGSAEMNEGTRKIGNLDGPIELRNLSFAYPDRDICLTDVSLELPQGKSVAVIGESGSGKSTLIDLIPRLIEPQAGAILINGRNARDYDLESLRDKVALATQEPFIFSASVAENIRAGKAGASDADIREACRLARIADFVESLPNKYQTLIGPGGEGLSGGQKQRIALARVFVSDAELLVLDEPTSALDPEIESELFDSVGYLVKEKRKTVIVVTHRAKFMDGAEVLVSVKDGQATRVR